MSFQYESQEQTQTHVWYVYALYEKNAIHPCIKVCSDRIVCVYVYSSVQYVQALDK